MSNMRVLYISPYYPPEVGAPQTRIHEQAAMMAQSGHEVSVLTTFPNYPSGVVPDRWRRMWFWNGTEDAVDIYRFWTFVTPNSGFFKRILSQLSFAIFGCIAGFRIPKFDIMVVESPPLFTGITANFLRVFRGAPYIFHVSDLWPETAVQLGVLRSPWLIRCARAMELYFYKRASMVVTVTEGIRKAIARDVGCARVVLFRNAVNTEFFCPQPAPTNIKTAFGIPEDRFLVLYTGTIGLSQNLDAAIDAAALFQQKNGSKVHFLFVGSGADKKQLQSKVAALNLENVTFGAPVSKTKMPALLAAADCVLVPLKNIAIFEAALPTKLFEAMSCARPVVLAANGEAEALVREANSGICANPGDPKSIHDAIEEIKQDPGEATRKGQRGRAYMLSRFRRENRVIDLLALMQQCMPVASTPPETLVKAA
ncbi:MAG: hypothetical protein JWO13_1769 [Acidobacteriales bacterium]|nr:hypothetical protein [Terriglobales bacterium]